MPARVRKNDTVSIIKGRDKGRTGKVLEIFPKTQMCIVEKVSVVKRHQKAKAQGGQPAGIVEKTMKIHLCKVMPFDGSAKKASRIRFEVKGKEKIRTFVKSGKAVSNG